MSNVVRSPSRGSSPGSRWSVLASRRYDLGFRVECPGQQHVRLVLERGSGRNIFRRSFLTSRRSLSLLTSDGKLPVYDYAYERVSDEADKKGDEVQTDEEPFVRLGKYVVQDEVPVVLVGHAIVVSAVVHRPVAVMGQILEQLITCSTWE
ncbi:unnamed protein product [Nesidiocoris tenuis]|uniref:Uncharacterized protein n=1 Tax=Nesidiocoris tenuis TaxID=355587 RepID=A0A6H5GL54_9HEMI|nr:unnamed protein product [Nesidiocoris tenuis]